MRALAALAVVVLTAGCFDPSPAEGLLCGPGDSCPGAQPCDRFAAVPVCRAPDSDAGVRPAPNFGAGGEPTLIAIPAGGFEMGCNKNIRSTCEDDEGPAHIVRLPAFELTRTEITAGQYNACVAIGPVAALPAGASPEGVMDLAGNVAEWVNDWWQPYTTERDDPRGPVYGTQRVIRGGHASSPAADLRSARRNKAAPEQQSTSVGFRCAR